MIKVIKFTKNANKDLKYIPKPILRKMIDWVRSVELYGVEEVRKIIGYHDEPLTGKRFGQRSIRLNKAYRLIYRIEKSDINFVNVIEVNKHEY